MFQDPGANTETVGIQYYKMGPSEGEDKPSGVRFDLTSVEFIIPITAGKYAHAALIKGFIEYFAKIMDSSPEAVRSRVEAEKYADDIIAQYREVVKRANEAPGAEKAVEPSVH